MKLTETFPSGECNECGLRDQKTKGNTCLSYVPDNFNGLMIIGEGPGRQEVAQNKPFVGQAGMYLKAFLEAAGLKKEECYITNATRCLPPPGKKKSLHDSFPTAIPACLGRLEAEIAAVRPRVIVPLGAAALVAVTGYDKPVVKRRPLDCDVCNDQRKVGPVIQCSKCTHIYWLNATCKENADPEEVKAIKAEPCAGCGARLKQLRPKMIKCLQCGGKRMELYTDSVFLHDYKISEIAGAIFMPGTDLPLDGHEIDPWYAEQGVKYVVPTYHPSFVARGNQFHAEIVVKHLRRAMQLLKKDVKFGVDFEITRDPDVVREFCFAPLNPLLLLPGDKINLATDIETEAWGTDEDGEPVMLDARKIENVTRITCIGFARGNQALVVDTRDVNPADPDEPLLAALYDVLTSDKANKTYHNGMCYDIPVIDLLWGIPYEQQLPSYTDDTLTAHHDLYPDELHNLAHVTFEMTDSYAWKPPKTLKGAEVHSSFEELALYNARDVINTGAAREAMGVDGGVAFQGGEMAKADLEKVYQNDTQLNRIAVSMFLKGMPLDLKRWDTVGDEAKVKLQESIETARETLAITSLPDEIKNEFNPFKIKAHLIPAIYTQDGFNLPITKQTDAGQASTSKDVLAGLMSQAGVDGMRFLRAVEGARDAKKTLSTYIEGQRPWADGRLHYSWRPHGTRTGRFSSSPNAQNWPGWLREAVMAPEGRMLCGADYAQLELRAMAALAGDAELIKRCLTAEEDRKLEPEYDPHSYIASVVFGETYTGLDVNDKVQLKKRKAMRTMTKAVIYALNYGAGDAKIVATIYAKGYDGPPVNVELVKRVRRVIFREFTGIPRWRDKQLETSTAAAELRSPIHNRRRIFPCSSAMPIPITETYNYPIQSIAADIMNETILLLHERLPDVDPSAFLFAQVHDAAYVECSEDKADAVAHLIEDTLTVEKSFDGGPPMIFNAAACKALTWDQAS
jgi:uracil-DNA glycosylase family 4